MGKKCKTCFGSAKILLKNVYKTNDKSKKEFYLYNILIWRAWIVHLILNVTRTAHIVYRNDVLGA